MSMPRCLLHKSTFFLMLVWVSGLAAQSVVKTESGRLQGASEAGVLAFKGIPYAAPPVGELRWRPPQPAARWTNLRSATVFGNDCMQLKAPTGKAKYRAQFSEDCLYLNVWTPANAAARKLPVMVWIYGGGFVSGGISADIYDGREFAKSGVILVSMNYRLGRFGFFAHPALTKASPTELLGNYGYMDQLAALKWVQRNIAEFGGDPANVTLFGESAGGFAVHTMLSSPLAHDLFQKAIVESGGGRVILSGISLHQRAAGKPSGEDVGLAFANQQGIPGEDGTALAKLRALPSEAVLGSLDYSDAVSGALTFSGPMIDGKLVTNDPGKSYFAGKQPRIPVIVGANSAEIGITVQFPQKAKNEEELFQGFGNSADAAQKAYSAGAGGDFTATSNSVLSDHTFVEPARFVARTFAETGQPVWEYRFSYVAESMRKQWKGAPHNTELWYVFDTLPARYGDAVTAGDEKMARALHEYWVQFARTGNPNQPGLPDWPKYDPRRDVLLNFTNGGPIAEPDPIKVRLDVTETVQ